MTEPVTVLLVDDHPVVRAGLRAVLDASDGIAVVGEASDGAGGLASARVLRPDVVLMDLQMGAGMDGVEATRRIAAMDDPPHVLILTTYDTDADILRAVEAGASGYLLKDAPTQQLVDAVHAAARGETVLAPPVAGRLMSRLRSDRRDLTGRELEVLTLVAAGKTNRDISKELYVSEATVKSHLVHIFAKLDVDSRTAAVARARESGVLR